MADSITLDALMQSKGHTALQVQKPASVEAVIAAISSVPTNFFLILNPPLKQYIIC